MRRREYLKHLGFATAAAICQTNQQKMIEASIKAKNEMIAGYMEVEKDGAPAVFPNGDNVYLYNGYWIPARKLKYNSSWDWLMVVIEKISKMPLLEADGSLCKDPQDVCYPRTFGMPHPNGGKYLFRFNGYACHEAETLIEAAFNAVCEVINSENLKNKK